MERTEKKIIGYTTGVFDMFHIGHLNILKTPIIKFEERIAIVEAIKYVDEVVPQTTMDKMEAWKQLKFDVMFHGSDWKGSDMYNHIIEKFNNVGVKVIFLPHTEGVSSTLLTEVLYDKKK